MASCVSKAQNACNRQPTGFITSTAVIVVSTSSSHLVRQQAFMLRLAAVAQCAICLKRS